MLLSEDGTKRCGWLCILMRNNQETWIKLYHKSKHSPSETLICQNSLTTTPVTEWEPSRRQSTSFQSFAWMSQQLCEVDMAKKRHILQLNWGSKRLRSCLGYYRKYLQWKVLVLQGYAGRATINNERSNKKEPYSPKWMILDLGCLST